MVKCEDLFRRTMFELKYDYLVCAMGCKTNTFGTPGVAEREGKDVFFLKHLWHARQIRQRTIACFERASMPGISEAERSSLLSFIVVGGGPTSCEFVTELHDFLRVDVARWYPDLAKLVRVTVVEAGPYILGSFDRALVDFYKKSLLKKDIDVRTETAVVGVREGPHPKEDFDWTIARLDNGAQIPFGMMVWSAGLAPVKFTENCNLPMDSKNGRIVIDDYLRVQGQGGRIFALGDCATHLEKPLPPLASVAEQQGQYLADCFNEYYSRFDPSSAEDLPPPGLVSAPVGMPFPRRLFKKSAEFRYINVGAMASMGFGGGVVDMTKADLVGGKGFKTMNGLIAMLAWRGGYLSKQLSLRNMLLIPLYWLKSLVFGRDISRF